MSYTENEIKQIVDDQRSFFQTNATLDVQWRIEQLRRLRRAVVAHRTDFEVALRADLGRTPFEGTLCDVLPTLLEIDDMLRHLRRWAKPECRFSGPLCFPSLRTKVYFMPFGVTLVISPFNFPILLSLSVMAASIAAGNTVVLKTSSKSTACTAALKRVVEETFPRNFAAVIDGGHDVADLCLAQRFDKIFYTGSPAVGRHVLAEAAKNLTPVTLELGGENGNWAVVRKDADLKDAARKIAFFKLLNAGQICINVNQVAVAEEVAESFLSELKAAFYKMIGPEPELSDEYPKLITQAAYDKCAAEAETVRSRIVYGGKGDRQSLKYAPTVVFPVCVDEPIVQHELFSPLLPVVPFKDDDVDSLLEVIASREHPLAFYLFTRSRRWAERVMRSQQYGGGCINEVCNHLMASGAPFGGTGHSGMGAYHGIYGFREFTHPQTVLWGSTHFNLPLRYHPYSGKAARWKAFVIGLMMRK